MNKEINIAILGFGVVGGGVAELVEKNSSLLGKRLGRKINIKYILDLRSFPDSPFADRITASFDDIINDKDIDIVAEAMGGSHPAYEFSKECLSRGISVITSNKEVVANFGPELLRVARENGARYLFEASVGGGIPCLRPFGVSFAVNRITSVDGILNGTTNYILSEMTQNGSEFSKVLRRAQELGYAEKDPTDDIEAIDASRKIVILCALAFGVMPKASDVQRTGITKITPDILTAASELGCKVKLVAHASVDGEKLCLKVEPAFVSKKCLLSSVDGVFNAVSVTSDALDEVLLCGKGAGRYPTASAMVADILEAGLRKDEQLNVHEIRENDMPCASLDEFSGRWVVLFEGNEEESFAELFGDSKIKLIPSIGLVAVLTEEKLRGEVSRLVREQGAVCHGIFEYK
ncbi:MAG: homoserine dehydrogenase [Ruminococcaceae bacterium]|nr:homoserine dehydrogenase [Oscillospiraceae bacterium]MBO4971691.1 homoserine dehydrogenase [Clostridia bacterium]MBQ1259331.1 homoserine dehydrogenase [Clostridia bacterium]